MATTKNLSIGQLSPDAVFATLQDKGLTASEATSFVGTWLLTTIGQSKRTFNFAEDFAGADPTWISHFVRTFAHQDWQDGVSVVQASETPGELGFNTRFHSIEKDIDALAANLALAFTLINTMRQAFFNMLQEVKVELNRIDTDLDNLNNKKTGPVISPTGVTTGAFLGFTKVNEAPMQLWQTNTGIVMVPDIAVMQGQAWINPRATRSGQLARFIADHPEVRQTFPQALTTQAFITSFGARQLPDGTFVRDLVASAPVANQYPTLDAMVTDVSDREAASLRTTEGARQAIATSLGLRDPAANIADAKLEQFGGLAPAARAALLKNGFTTLSKFADLPPDRAAEVLKKEGVAGVSLSDLSDASNVAKTLIKLG
jgi:hypothetical protein